MGSTQDDAIGRNEAIDDMDANDEAIQRRLICCDRRGQWLVDSLASMIALLANSICTKIEKNELQKQLKE